MPVNTVSSLASQTYKDLESLKAKIEESASNVNKDDLHNLIVKLRHEANQLATAMAKTNAPLEVKVKDDLTSLLHNLKHLSTMTEALGQDQVLLFGAFRRLENCIKDTKFENKVTRTENDPLS